MKANFLETWSTRFFGSVAFLGFIPGMPGTIGAAAGGGLAWLALHRWTVPLPYYVVLLAVLSIPCFFFAERSQKSFGRHDPSAFVLDEVLGQMITFIGVMASWKSLVMGFLYFSFFDIIKPYPVLESERIEGGVGINMDDIVAGLYACITLNATVRIYDIIMKYLIS